MKLCRSRAFNEVDKVLVADGSAVFGFRSTSLDASV